MSKTTGAVLIMVVMSIIGIGVWLGMQKSSDRAPMISAYSAIVAVGDYADEISSSLESALQARGVRQMPGTQVIEIRSQLRGWDGGKPQNGRAVELAVTCRVNNTEVRVSKTVEVFLPDHASILVWETTTDIAEQMARR